jgi:hypothetical protein
MDEQMNEWINGETDRWTEEGMDGKMNEWRTG